MVNYFNHYPLTKGDTGDCNSTLAKGDLLTNLQFIALNTDFHSHFNRHLLRGPFDF